MRRLELSADTLLADGPDQLHGVRQVESVSLRFEHLAIGRAARFILARDHEPRIQAALAQVSDGIDQKDVTLARVEPAARKDAKRSGARPWFEAPVASKHI